MEEILDKIWLEPVILDTYDAKRHPSYKPYSEILKQGHFKRNQDKYNYFCFLRWIAASASGGGWMADYDTFPLNLSPNHTLPNNGKFTGHAHFVPNLISGSVTEWNRMARLIMWAFRRNEKLAKNDKKLRTTGISDMHAARFLFKTMSAFTAEQSTRQLHDFYVTEKKQIDTGATDPYDLTHKCSISNDMKAIHFSHWSCGQVWFCRESAVKNSTGVIPYHFQRSKVIQNWMEAWNVQCKEKYI